MRVAAGFVIFRLVQGEVQYLLLRASYGIQHWSPPKGDDFDESNNSISNWISYYVIFSQAMSTLVKTNSRQPCERPRKRRATAPRT